MTQQIAMLIEASGIQDFVFGSNELRQNIGASELVTAATTDWLFDVDGLLPRRHNVTRAAAGEADRWTIGPERLADDLADEVVYSGGGKALILFRGEAPAGEFAFQLTKKALQEAPGLRLVVASQPCEAGGLVAAVAELHDRIAEMKRAPQPAGPLLGLGVTAACTYTGAPAVGRDEKGRYVSAEVAAKQAAGKPEGPGNRRLLDYLDDVRHDFGFVYDFDRLGLRDESSYLAVAHIDGNRMGERIGKYTQDARDDSEFVARQREFSVRVKEAAHAALVSTVGLLLAPANLKLDPEEKRGRWRYKIAEKIPVPFVGGEDLLPFRPIVFGGDDVTFVCEGRLGLPLAAHYLERLAEETLPDGAPLYGRAGIAIVKTHYPFSRAYDLAEELSASAKEHIQKADPKQRAVSALDWHFATTGMIEPLAALRRREYRLGPGEDAPTLLMRPLRVAPAQMSEWRSWDVFCDITGEFLRAGGPWAGRRNKVKALRDALRLGREAARLFLRSQPDHPELPCPDALRSQGDAATTGWQGRVCTHYDAVEALDFVVQLREV